MTEKMSKRIEELIGEDIEAAEAEQTERPLPAHVEASRLGHARSKMLHVRLNPDEYEALERIAERREQARASCRGLPATGAAQHHASK